MKNGKVHKYCRSALGIVLAQAMALTIDPSAAFAAESDNGGPLAREMLEETAAKSGTEASAAGQLPGETASEEATYGMSQESGSLAVLGDAAPTLWVVGDSTVSAFTDAYYYPRYGYGTQLSEYFTAGSVTVNNLALSGRSSKSFRSEENYATLTEGIKAGDFLIIGFGHNDEKAEDEARYTDPKGDYQTEGSFAHSLYTYYVKVARDAGATPILCTPIVRRPGSADGTFKDSELHITSSGDYPAAIRTLGQAVDVPVIDLTERTKALYTELGPANTLYLHAWTNQKETSVDATHTNIWGARYNAWFITQGIRSKGIAGLSDKVVEAAAPTKEATLVVNPDYVAKDYAPPTTESSLWPTVDGWKGTAFGDLGGNPSAANYTMEAANGGIHMKAANNKGKIGSNVDGILMYYKAVPVGKQFTLTANMRVNDFDANNQVSFGLMARDDMYIDVYDKTINSDYVAAAPYKLAGSNPHNCFARKDVNIVDPAGEASFATASMKGQTIALSIKSNSDGYTCQIGDETPVSGGFDFQLTSVDSEYVYVGMFCARNADVTFTDIVLDVEGGSEGPVEEKPATDLSLAVSPEKETYTVGDTITITPTLTPADSTDRVAWRSSDAAVATVTGGVVKALAAGEATIMATAGAVSKTVAIKVQTGTAPVEEKPATDLSLAVSPERESYTVGDSITITPTVTPADSTDQVAWESSDTAVAMVRNGIVSAIAAGEATITATAGSISRTVSIVVKPLSKSAKSVTLTVSPNKAVYDIGESVTIQAVLNPTDTTDEVSWENSNAAVAEISPSADGKSCAVTTRANGEVTITARAGSVSRSVKLLAKKQLAPAKSIVILESSLPTDGILYSGDTVELNLATNPVNTTDEIVWESSNASVAQVADGVVTGVAAGRAVITVTAGNASDSVTITVREKMIGLQVSFDSDKNELDDKGRAVLTYTGQALMPAVLVTNNGVPLTEGIDYSLKYTNNINAAKATSNDKPPMATVTGMGSFSGGVTLFFTISRAPIAGARVGNLTVARGGKVSPVVIVDGMTLTEKKDYTVSSRKGNLAKLEQTIDDLVIEGTGNYAGTLSDLTVTVSSSAPGKLMVSMSRTVNRTYSYTGSPIQLKAGEDIMVTDTAKRSLAEGTDFILSYADNTNAGTAKVTVTGIGSFAGSVKKTFKILPDASAKTAVVAAGEEGVTYAKGGVTPAVTVTAENGTVLTAGRDYKVAYSGNKKIGRGVAKVTFLGNYKGSKLTSSSDLDFQVVAADLGEAATGAEVFAADMIYTKAKSYKSAPYVTVNGALLSRSEYSVKYEGDQVSLSGESSGRVRVTVTGKGGYNGSISTEYEVVKPAAGVLDLSRARVEFYNESGRKATKFAYYGEPVVPDTVRVFPDKKSLYAVSEDDYKVLVFNNVGKGKATVVIAPSGNGSAAGAKVAKFTVTAGSLR